MGALLHGLAVLDMFSWDRPVVGIGEVSRQLGVHRSTASRLAATLATAGYLEPAGEQGRYRLAAKLYLLGELAVAGNQLRRAALPPLRELVSNLGETGHLGILDGTEAVTVAVVDGWQTAGCTRGWASGPPRTAARWARRCSPGWPSTTSRPGIPTPCCSR
ncbi:MAG: IclR family transcriptional regulator [Trebonia sp.]